MAASYDTIIVGAGSAGCVLAARLGEDSARRILVLEAGGEDKHWLIHLPLGVGKVWNNPRWNWNYQSEPEPFLDNRRIEHPRGKVVGGSSSINIMAYVRCHRIDYDRLPQMGLKGWSFADVLPYFKRAESYEDGGNLYRGDSGPLKTCKNLIQDPIWDAFAASASELGYSEVDDFNAAEQQGFSRLQHTIGNGRRSSAAVAYLRPAMQRGNIELITQAHATRVLFDGPRAIGIEYIKDGQKHQAHADSEVILAGGAFNSPQLLLLSGIGPADELTKVGVEPRVDLKGVGKNMSNHPVASTQWIRAKGQGTFHKGLRMDRLAISLAQYFMFGTGFATRVPAMGTAFTKSEPGLDAPDLQFYCGGGGFRAHEWFPIVKPPEPDVFGLTYCHLRPESRGEVKLAWADPLAPIKIYNNFFATEYDRRAMREGMKFALHTVEETKAFAGFARNRVFPGPEVKTDAEIDAFLRANTATIHHPAGTCKIGIDSMAVVDPEFRVRGTEHLRVIDASIIPDPIGGNLNAPVIMIAEKASDAIRGRPPLPPADI